MGGLQRKNRLISDLVKRNSKWLGEERKGHWAEIELSVFNGMSDTVTKKCKDGNICRSMSLQWKFLIFSKELVKHSLNQRSEKKKKERKVNPAKNSDEKVSPSYPSLHSFAKARLLR